MHRHRATETGMWGRRAAGGKQGQGQGQTGGGMEPLNATTAARGVVVESGVVASEKPLDDHASSGPRQSRAQGTGAGADHGGEVGVRPGAVPVTLHGLGPANTNTHMRRRARTQVGFCTEVAIRGHARKHLAASVGPGTAHPFRAPPKQMASAGRSLPLLLLRPSPTQASYSLGPQTPQNTSCPSPTSQAPPLTRR